jgi:hypothetical protein
MLRILTDHPEEHEIAVSAVAVVASDPRGLDQSPQQDAVGYLITENRILREKLGKKRILLNDGQRRRLARFSGARYSANWPAS